MAQPLLSDRDFFKLFEFVVIPAFVLGFLGWQLLSVRASLRSDRARAADARKLDARKLDAGKLDARKLDRDPSGRSGAPPGHSDRQ